MKELLDKISSYNLFNYLFPGVVYAVIMEYWTKTTLIQENILASAFLLYFIGLVISRMGSLIIEPILKKIGFVKFADYSDFVKLEKDDKKLEILSEANNMYRTLTSLFLIILMSKAYFLIAGKYDFQGQTNIWVISISLFILFLFSYRKQTSYITKRIKAKLT
jgi:hypothetical protein